MAQAPRWRSEGKWERDDALGDARGDPNILNGTEIKVFQRTMRMYTMRHQEASSQILE